MSFDHPKSKSGQVTGGSRVDEPLTELKRVTTQARNNLLTINEFGKCHDETVEED